MVITRKGPGKLKVTYDSNDFETPCMVYIVDANGHVEASATFMCALSEGEVEHIELTDDQYVFLNDQEKFANDFYDKHRVVK